MNKEKILTLSLIGICSIAIFYLGGKTIATATENNWLNSQRNITKKLEKTYAAEIESHSDVNALMTSGLQLLRGNQINCAIINFKRVTELEKNYRDGWLYLGIAELQNSDPETALISLQAAEKLDPINPLTYQYLTMAYEQTDDIDSAQKAREKYEYLTKKK